MKNLFLVLFTCAICLTSYAQEVKLNKKAVDLYERGVEKLRNGDTKEGIVLVQKALEIEPKYVEALLSLGSAYGELKNYQSSVTYFEKARAMDPEGFSYYNLPYSINLAG